MIADRAGQDWLVYHAINRTDPYLPGTRFVRRPMLIDRIVYRNGWPTVAHRSPSTSWQPAPR